MVMLHEVWRGSALSSIRFRVLAKRCIGTEAPPLSLQASDSNNMATNFEGLNSITLNAGDDFPPLAPGRMRLYSMRFCPFAHRTTLYIAKKNLPVEVVNVNLKEKPDWFLQRNPLGKAPTIEHDGKVVYESLVVNEYLDEMFPDTAILPTDPYKRAQQKILVERLSSLSSAFFAFIMNKDGVFTQAIENMEKALANAESLLVDDFYGGKHLGFADCSIWPIFERFPVITLNKDIGVKEFPGSQYPKLSAYIKRMKHQPAVKAVMRPTKQHQKFLKSAWVDGKPDYNLGI